jgi:hypothetical protein
MDIFRLFGYAIEPQRTVTDEDFVDPEGGSLPIRAQLRSALSKSLKVAEDSGLMTQVTLDVDQRADGHRSSLVRNAVIDLAFRRGAASERGALELARQLSRAMDYRSRDCLFLCAAYREGEKRQVALWIFPQDEAFRFSVGGAQGPDIDLLTEIFSRTSALRKMALFEGREISTNFLDGRVLDFQVGRADDVADLWIRRFLEARTTITPAAGTKLLADALKKTSRADIPPEERKQVLTAAIAVNNMQRQSWSLEQVAHEFLAGKAKEIFLAAAENDEARSAVFRLDRPALARRLNTRTFQLPEDVLVSAPINEVGDDKVVEVIDDTDGERIRIEAQIVEERLASRNA